VPIVPYRIEESQVDWITLTRRGSYEHSPLLELGELILAKELKVDPSVTEWTWRGYLGKRGEHFAYGKRYDSDILQLSSFLADEYFDLAWPRADNCTRIDLAVTVVYDGGRERIAAECYQQGIEYDRAHGRDYRRSLIVNAAGGSTCYLGSRESDLFARIYDKWRESGSDDYRFAWRWEIEAKGDIANRVGHMLSACGDRQRAITDTVSTHFKRRGNVADWMASSGDLRVTSKRPASRCTTRLAWLGSSARPVIEKLLPIVGEEAILEVLGLSTDEVHRLRIRRADRFDGHSMGD
jgi:hypothetical protein